MTIEAMKQALEALERYSGIDQRACDAEDALRTAIEQAEKQEPYGYFKYDMRLDAWVKSQTNRGVPFYTIPPAAQRQPLTDEQIRDLWSWSATTEAERTANTQQHAFARAIEAAHGIKE